MDQHDMPRPKRAKAPTKAELDRDDFEQRWLAECRAHRRTQRRLDRAVVYTHRIRRCDGNTDAWLLVALNDDGKEMLSHGSYTTALSIDSLLRHSGGLLPTGDDAVQIVYYAPEGK